MVRRIGIPLSPQAAMVASSIGAATLQIESPRSASLRTTVGRAVFTVSGVTW